MNKLEINLRKATPEDGLPLAALASRSLPGYPFESIYDPTQVAESIRDGENRVVAVLNSEEVVGTAVLGSGNMAEIKRVLVDPTMRGKGIGSALTSYLKTEAVKLGVIPWADVRADQIGMQKAAYYTRLRLHPTSVEQGKHVVYEHSDKSGPARESMIHMNSLMPRVSPDKPILDSGWTTSLIHSLVRNMESSLVSHTKDVQLAASILPSASLVKSQIENNLSSLSLRLNRVAEDLVSVDYHTATCLVVTPDCSGFISGSNPKDLIALADMLLSSGLQVVTCYLDARKKANLASLCSAGFTPAMIRPWQDTPSAVPVWQVGVRKTANHYDRSLHSVNIEPWIHAEIMETIRTLDSLISIYSGYNRNPDIIKNGAI